MSSRFESQTLNEDDETVAERRYRAAQDKTSSGSGLKFCGVMVKRRRRQPHRHLMIMPLTSGPPHERSTPPADLSVPAQQGCTAGQLPSSASSSEHIADNIML